MILLGTARAPDGTPLPGGTPEQQTGTFMHELGHTLGLLHGGGDEELFKPNYHSVMNYTWQTPAPVSLPGASALALTAYRSSWKLDYSRTALPALDEADLLEAAGIGGDPRHWVPVGPLPAKVVREGGPVDWDRSGTIGLAGGISANANHVAQNPVYHPFTLPIQSLRGHNDWSAIRLPRVDLAGGDFVDGVHLAGAIVESTTDLVDELSDIPFFDCNLNGLNDHDDLGAGTSQDSNANGVLDECEGVLGDLDDDGDVDDVDGLVLTQTLGLSEGEAGYLFAADLDADRSVTAADVGLWLIAYNDFTGSPTQCSDGVDNDGDGLIDFLQDPQCVTVSDNREGAAGRRCGLLGVEPCLLLAAWRRRRRASGEASRCGVR